MSATRASALRITAICALAALLVPWFSFDETFVKTHSSLGWGLLWSSTCSDFAKDSFECRYEVFDRGVEWLLIPLFVLTRLLALISTIALLCTVVMVPKRAALVGSGALLAFAIHIAAVPGDMQYRNMEPWWGALFGVVAALVAITHDLPSRTRVVPVLGALLVLGSALWLPWITEVEAIFPADPKEQSARSYGTISETHHWHSFRNSRRHYVEDAPGWNSLASLRGRDVLEYGPGVLTALAGLVLSAALLARARDEARIRVLSLVAAAAFTGFGVMISFSLWILRPKVPGSGAVVAAIVVLSLLAAEIRRRVASSR